MVLFGEKKANEALTSISADTRAVHLADIYQNNGKCEKRKQKMLLEHTRMQCRRRGQQIKHITGSLLKYSKGIFAKRQECARNWRSRSRNCSQSTKANETERPVISRKQQGISKVSAQVDGRILHGSSQVSVREKHRHENSGEQDAANQMSKHLNQPEEKGRSTKNLLHHLLRQIHFFIMAVVLTQLSMQKCCMVQEEGQVGPGRWADHEDEEGSNTTCRKLPDAFIIKGTEDEKEKKQEKEGRAQRSKC